MTTPAKMISLAEAAAKNRAEDPIALMVAQRFQRAQQYRNTHKIGNYSIEQTLNNCWQQYNGIYSCTDAEVIEATGVDLNISITKHKVDVLVAWYRDLWSATSEQPIILTPTPIPELSKAGIDEVTVKLEQIILDTEFDAMSPAGVIDEARRLKELELQLEREYASRAVGNMQLLIYDQMRETNYRQELIKFLGNLALYPYAVMVGPLTEMVPAFKWKGNKPVMEQRPMLVTKNVSPFNYFWSADSPSSGKGTFDIIRERITKKALLQCKGAPGFIDKNIDEVVTYFSASNVNTDWISPEPDRSTIGMFTDISDTVVMLKHYGSVSGRELQRYGLSVTEDQYYEIEAMVIGQWTVRIMLNPNPDKAARPVMSTAFQKIDDQIAGYAIAQNVRDIERMFMTAMRGFVNNINYSSAPMGEIVYDRVAEYMDVEDMGKLTPGQLTIVKPDLAGTAGGAKAISFYNHPNHAGSLENSMRFCLDLADRWTGLPAALSGQPVGTGVNRTFRGLLQLYSNALKGVQSSLVNVDRDILELQGQTFYNFNMVYSDDPSVRGDAIVVARGTSGLIEKEVDDQAVAEMLPLLLEATQAGITDPRLAKYVVDTMVNEVLKKSGKSAEGITEGITGETTPQQQPQQPEMVQQVTEEAQVVPPPIQ